jgi:hypothetical protein
MRAYVAACVAAATAGLAGCSGPAHPAPAASTHRAGLATPKVSLTPAPLSAPPLVGNSQADRAVCYRFVRLSVTRTSASRFVAWAKREAAKGAAQRMINDIVRWYDDSSTSSGKPNRVPADLATVTSDCRSIGIFGPG